MSTPTVAREAAGALPGEVRRRAERYVEDLDRRLPGRLVALYLVGSPALGDFSPRQSNVDLVAVTDRRLEPVELKAAARAHRALGHAGRDAGVCYVTAADLAGRPHDGAGVTFVGRSRVAPARLANPLTWAILHDRPVALRGPGHPAVRSEPDDLKAWGREALAGNGGHGTLLWRRATTRLVLESARAAVAAGEGRAVSLRDAAASVLETATSIQARIVRDASGYRQGGTMSMYWGPLERRKDARNLRRALRDRAAAS